MWPMTTIDCLSTEGARPTASTALKPPLHARTDPEGRALAQEAAHVGLRSVRTNILEHQRIPQKQSTPVEHRHTAPVTGRDVGATEEAPTLMQVFEAIRPINDAGGEPTRERIVAMTGLKPTTVDDRIKVLRGEGRPRRTFNEIR